ncbi:MAG TPA: Tab2/Atab2 family RNA-binding protein [Oscillatoriaceae cyanobacterium M33_DOE_052]|uniref:DUF1092 family protein n=1 Tax=Planktothricoides sp. SpSt-374 TaxID=2282167 RepID=A0A7C3VSY7_9CYAN|nr:Tab2/Atab2 family RNA-binding protein [Oscillatoriaceae cyanobacterium M33_DOE_052]
MTIWQADFYRRPLKNERGQPLWELVVCDPTGEWVFTATCPQHEANSAWLSATLSRAQSGQLPEVLQVFRPQCLSLLMAAAKNLEIAVEATRRTPALKYWLRQQAAAYAQTDSRVDPAAMVAYDPLALDRPPPVPLPDGGATAGAVRLWGESWRFGSILAGDMVAWAADRPLPVREMPEYLWPVNLGLASTAVIPGVAISGGRQSLKLARWLQEVRPVSLNYIPGAPDGLILEAGLVDRWILATFDDEEMATAARTYQQRLQLTKGLHFLLVQPDDSGMTYSGFWLLQHPE